MAYQFFHIETYSQAPKKVRKTADHFNTAEQVEEEACRTPDYYQHVETPRPYQQLVNCTPIDTFIEQRRAKVAALTETVKAKGGGTYTRALRSDAATLYTEVHSHPVTSAAFLADPSAYRDEVKLWAAKVMKDFRARMPEGVVHTAVLHTDESHLHIHILAYNDADPKMDANKLHVGKKAAAEYRATHESDTIASLDKPELEPLPLKPKKPKPSKSRTTQAKNEARYAAAVEDWEEIRVKVQAENDAMMADWKCRNHAHLKAGRLERGKAGDQEAYLGAMQKAQDAYYEAVGLPCGFLRHGPRQERLSTKQYAARQRDAKHKAKVARKLEDSAVKLGQADENLSMMRREIIEAASEREAELDAREDALEAREQALEQRTAALDAQEEDLMQAANVIDSVLENFEAGEAIDDTGRLNLSSILPLLGNFKPTASIVPSSSRGSKIVLRFVKLLGAISNYSRRGAADDFNRPSM